MTAALAASGGCRIRATIGTAQLNGSFTFGQSLTLGRISDVAAEGQITLGDGRSARYVGLLGERPERIFFVNDETLISGRAWAQIPEMGTDLLDPESLMKEHLPYIAAVRAVPPLDPQSAPITVIDPVREEGAEMIEGVSTTHYSWGSPSGPVFDVWLDSQDRPVRFAIESSDQPTSTATYDQWGPRPTIRRPAAADTTVLPVGHLG